MFLERLGASMTLVEKVTGDIPDMHGEVVLDQCPHARDCLLQWRAGQGRMELCHAQTPLLQAHLTTGYPT
ncbi:hypothetical protein [Roseinatronobacter alkalisoli]|uniref:Uncharacterized protein n=1 Tax=Roseinatronobacter alkalisoli TaxID=3028235 RepID=A0ABT5T8A5_9RHOB|nr:hypothetical protein [Roseinatronobacter sp. HJB301]MDD7971211.1 hypothetical protein [Roseinatronobacter sp. HJB301]